ncbi:MAG: tRNA epoxyqueuosine(34) reductase QueG [Pseudomonadota bacterium]
MLPTRQDLRTWAQELGFQDIGITDVDLSAHEPHVRSWLAAGFAGDMSYLHRNLDKRLHPPQLEPGTCRVISARMDYLPANTQPLRILADPQRGYISRYALGRDYHKVLRRRLARLAARINESFPQHHYRAFTDTAPVLEKALAEKAGLGWIGKHTLLLNQQAGSWFFVGEIYTNAPFPVDTQPVADACGKCNACITVCPTQAIIGPQRLDARRCISYLTIEHRGVIPEALRPLMGNRIYGCDDCQLYCPWNRDAPDTNEPDFAVRHQLDNPTLLKLFALDASEFDQLTRGSAMRRISYAQWQRNLAVAIGNGPPSHTAIKLLKQRLGKAEPLVAEHIQWALERLQKEGANSPEQTAAERNAGDSD